MHALHTEFDDELKKIEKSLNIKMQGILNAVIDQFIEEQKYFHATDIEEDADQAIEYLFVALRLFDPNAEVPSEYEQIVDQQVELIMEAGGKDDSLIIADFVDDYGAYRPVGHYAGDPNSKTISEG